MKALQNEGPSEEDERQATDAFEPFLRAVSRRMDRESRKKARTRSIVGLTLMLASIYLLLGKVFAISFVRGDSMEPLLHDGDMAVFSRLGGYEAGDVVILQMDRTNYVKRIVGMDGDVVMIDARDGEVLVNGVRERYSSEGTYWRQQGITFPTAVPEGSVFVLGDNRQVSRDSREFGSVDSSHLIGTLLCVLPIGGAYRSVLSIAHRCA